MEIIVAQTTSSLYRRQSHHSLTAEHRFPMAVHQSRMLYNRATILSFFNFPISPSASAHGSKLAIKWDFSSVSLPNPNDIHWIDRTVFDSTIARKRTRRGLSETILKVTRPSTGADLCRGLGDLNDQRKHTVVEFVEYGASECSRPAGHEGRIPYFVVRVTVAKCDSF